MNERVPRQSRSLRLSAPTQAANPQSEIAQLDDVLAAVVEVAERLGVAGEARLVSLIYLVLTSRLLKRGGVSLVVKGLSSSGKSFIVGVVLKLFPASAFILRTAMSPAALVLGREPLSHRTLVLFEAAALKTNRGAYFLRSLLSEGRASYEITVKRKDGSYGTDVVSRKGPLNLIVTTTALALDYELETRLLSAGTTDTAEQTSRILKWQAVERPRVSQEELERWRTFQEWLASRVVPVRIPFGEALSDLISPYADRMRRDHPTLRALIKVHALLHQEHRRQSRRGGIRANIRDDYTAIYKLTNDLFASGSGLSVDPLVRQVVEAVKEIAPDVRFSDGATVRQVADLVRVHESTAWRRVHEAIRLRYLKNLERNRGRPAQLIPGDPLPDERPVLPTPKELVRRYRKLKRTRSS